MSGLAEEAFTVFEDGVRQELSFFARDAMPLSVALLVDCSASMEQKIGVAQEAGVRFVRALRPGDLAEVVQFNDRVRVLHDCSDDAPALEGALRSTRPSGATVLYNALYVTLKELRTQGTPDVPRRRAVVLLSDGEDTASLATEDQVLELARKAEIAIYAIRLRSELPLARERDGQYLAKYFLTTLARDTGGQVFFPDRLSDLRRRCTRASRPTCAASTRWATCRATPRGTAAGGASRCGRRRTARCAAATSSGTLARGERGHGTKALRPRGRFWQTRARP